MILMLKFNAFHRLFLFLVVINITITHPNKNIPTYDEKLPTILHMYFNVFMCYY